MGWNLDFLLSILDIGAVKTWHPVINALPHLNEFRVFFLKLKMLIMNMGLLRLIYFDIRDGNTRISI